MGEQHKYAGSESRREADKLRLPEFAREAPEGGRPGMGRHEMISELNRLHRRCDELERDNRILRTVLQTHAQETAELSRRLAELQSQDDGK